jgi:hypothetical protein
MSLYSNGETRNSSNYSDEMSYRVIRKPSSSNDSVETSLQSIAEHQVVEMIIYVDVNALSLV